MADKSYPSDLPRTEITSYSYSLTTDSLRTDSDEALYYRRRRTETQIYEVNLSFIFNDEQMRSFRDWYGADLTQGSEIFDFELAFGDGIKTNEAKFVGGKFGYALLDGSNDWSVSATAEVWAADVLDDVSNYITATFTLGGSSSYVVPLSLGTYESLSYSVSGSEIIDLSGGTYEDQQYTVGDSEEIDLSLGTYESGST